MDVVFAESIRSFIEEYEIALMKYPISKDRALQKKQEMIDFFYKKLPSVGRYTLRICPYKRLGQILRNGQPQLPYLLMGSYQDKSSRTTWLFSCIMDEDTDTLTICHILHSNGVYESKTSDRISITESDIRKMVRECICKVIQEQYPQEYQLGKYKCVDGYAEYYNIEEKGLCRGIRMYMDMSSKDKTTYCLFQRADNKKFFYCEIVPAPEKGPKETKFLPLPLSKVPQSVRQDFPYLHR